ncbi:MAG: hypothetical protein PHN69_03730 [Candidatus Pacebacteria bacterium]|nr:hypothetical protein [Candidatus Paceibacterota bacterium]
MKIFKSLKCYHSIFAVFSILLFFSFFISKLNSVIAQTSDADSVVVTLDVIAGIAIDSPSDVSMSRPLSMTNMTAIGTSTWNVVTNNAAGYNLTVKADTSPAMQQNVGTTTTIADYNTGIPTLWSVSAGTAKFGFSAFGPDTSDVTWGTGETCSGEEVNDPSSSLKYLGFTTSSTSSFAIATRSSTTTFAGSATTICFAVEQNGFYIPSGQYTATITATAVTI